jgi:hypothetical protein
LFVDARPRRPNGDARRERCADLRVAGYLSILILPSEFAKHAKRSICFSLLLVPPSARKKSINGLGGTAYRFIQVRGVIRPRQGLLPAEAR